MTLSAWRTLRGNQQYPVALGAHTLPYAMLLRWGCHTLSHAMTSTAWQTPIGS